MQQFIYWFTGQPGHGKTTLARALKRHLENHGADKVFHIDGDDLRALSSNQSYDREGREKNVRLAMQIAMFLSNQGYNVVVSLLAPYRAMREDFKAKVQSREIYIHADDVRGREKFFAADYEPPLQNFLSIDTTKASVEESIAEICQHFGL